MHHSTKRGVALGITTGGLLVTGLGMSSAYADTTATAGTSQSGGIGSGNVVQIPVNAPINICGDQIGVIAILNAVAGSTCVNDSGSTTMTPLPIPAPTPTPHPVGCGCPPSPPHLHPGHPLRRASGTRHP